ncbi:hypothetical protein [Streptomyces omiyaensis]|uniref:hypothetical protein n=1 Tax=Streptomyces omiyaensis TaxID=68247 RepID=UPI0036F7A80A
MKCLVRVEGSHAGCEAVSGRGSAQSPAWDEESPTAMSDFTNGLGKEPLESGEMPDGQGAADPGETRLVPVDAEGRPVVRTVRTRRPRRSRPATGSWGAQPRSA